MEQFQCSECGMILMDQEKIKNHMNKVHKIKVEKESTYKFYSCSLCSFNAKDMNMYKNHQIKLHNKEQHNWMVDEISIEYKCEECDIEFPTDSAVKSHADTVHEQQRDDVEEIEVKTEAIETDQDVALGPGFKCDFCERYFSTFNGKGIHEGKKHKEECSKKETLKCEICPWTGTSKRVLDNHKKEKHIELLKRTINKEQPYKCYFCGFI